MAIADFPSQKTEAQLRIKELSSLTPQITAKLGQINLFVSKVFQENTELYRIYTQTQEQENYEQYVADILLYPKINSHNESDFRIIHEQLIEPEKEYVKDQTLVFTKTAHFFIDTFVKNFPESKTTASKTAKENFQKDSDVFSRIIFFQQKSQASLNYWAAYPLFLKRLYSMAHELFNLILQEQNEIYAGLSDIEKEEIATERDQILQDKQSLDEKTPASLPLPPPRKDLSPSDAKSGKASVSLQAEKIRIQREKSVEQAQRMIGGLRRGENIPTLDEIIKRVFEPGMTSKELEIVYQQLQEQYAQKRSKLGRDSYEDTNNQAFSLEKLLQQETKLKESIENYAAVAAYFETVPPELLVQLQRELGNIDPKMQSQFTRYFENVRVQEQNKILRINGGKLPLWIDSSDFNDPKLRQLLSTTKIDTIERLAELKASIPSSEQFHKTLVIPLSVNRQQLAETETVLSLADKNSEAFKKSMEAYREQAYIVALQEQFIENKQLNLDGDQQSQRRQFQHLFGQEEIILDPNTTIVHELGLEEIEIPEDSYSSANFSDIDEDEETTESSRAGLFSRLIGNKRGNSPKEISGKLQKTRKSLDRLKKTANLAKIILSNPTAVAAGIGGIGAGLSLYSLLTNLPVGVATLSGGVLGGIAGALIGGPIGAGVGFTFGSLAGNALGSFYFQPAAAATESIRSAGLLGKEGVSALTKATPEAVSNFSKTASSLAQSGQTTASHLATKGVNASKALFEALPNASIGASPTILIPSAYAGIAGVSLITATIISGAFLVDGTLTGVTDESKYVEIKKEIVPPSLDHYENSALDDDTEVVTYKITITPKNDEKTSQPYEITLNTAKDVARIVSASDPAPSAPDMETPMKAALGAIPQTITTSKSFTYQITYNKSYVDTRITNVFTITFDVNLNGQQVAKEEVAGTATSVSFGTPPNDVACLQFEDSSGTVAGVDTKDWTDIEKEVVIQAFGPMSQYQTYIEKLCNTSDGTVHLYRASGSKYGGFTPRALLNSIILYDGGIMDSGGAIYSPSSVRYTLVHETGHIIYYNNSDVIPDYIQSVNGPLMQTYLYYNEDKGHDDEESLAESIGVFAVYKYFPLCTSELNAQGRCSTPKVLFNFPSENSSHYKWVQDSIFDGQEPPGN